MGRPYTETPVHYGLNWDPVAGINPNLQSYTPTGEPFPVTGQLSPYTAQSGSRRSKSNLTTAQIGFMPAQQSGGYANAPYDGNVKGAPHVYHPNHQNPPVYPGSEYGSQATKRVAPRQYETPQTYGDGSTGHGPPSQQHLGLPFDKLSGQALLPPPSQAYSRSNPSLSPISSKRAAFTALNYNIKLKDMPSKIQWTTDQKLIEEQIKDGKKIQAKKDLKTMKNVLDNHDKLDLNSVSISFMFDLLLE